MDDCNREICRLCLEKRPACECENVDEIKKMMLEVSLLDIDFHISDYAVACNKCLEKIQDSFDFKSLCVTTFVEAEIKPDVDHDEKKSLEKCRLCMSLTKVNNLKYITELKPRVPWKDKITDCLSEMDLNTERDHCVCKPCLASIICYYRFMKSCKKLDALWHLAGHGSEAIDVLEEMLGKVMTKSECLDVENEVMEATDLKNEDIASIECEEVHIKDELDSGEEMVESVTESVDCSSGAQNGPSKKTSRIRKSASKGKQLYFCPKCPYSTKWRNLSRHMLVHLDSAEGNTHPERNGDLSDVFSRPSSDEKMKFECHICKYKTNRKDSLNRHVSTVHEWERATVYSCAQCTYETVDASNFKKHCRRHREKLTKNRMCKCRSCAKGLSGKQGLDCHLLKKDETL